MTKKLILSTFAMLIMLFVMRWLGTDLKSEISPAGIVSFELAKDYTKATQIMQAVPISALILNTIVDFLFIIAYTTFFFLCCKVLWSRYRSERLKNLGYFFLKLSVVGGMFDIIENTSMLLTLSRSGNEVTTTVSYWAALIKFSVLAIVIAYILIASIILVIKTKKIIQ